MSSDEEDGLCRFGTPLDPIEEDEVPSSKKITLADQIAVDSNGRRRFHGAFTGGFSAGYWNTVGSRDGWTPSEFKSSRGEKASHRLQTANDFMDEEDVGEFGIAPQRIQTTEDFGPSENRQSKNKRKLQSESQGPIPGVPVLELVLESSRDKAAVRLLKRMDKRYAAALVEKPKKPVIPEPEELAEEVNEPDESDTPIETVSDGKVYKCDMGPIRRPRSKSQGSDADSSDDDGEELVFDEDEFDAIFDNFKTNRFGLSYVGLDKGNFFTTVGAEAPIIQNNYNSLSSFTMVDQNKKKVTIKGQAFGVGAFEEDDDDIYGRDDMTKYDFRLDTKAIENGSSKSKRHNERGFIRGFTDTTKSVRITTKNIFKVSLSFDFEPRNWLKRKSRFGPEVLPSTSHVKGPSDKVIGRHDLTPDQRGELLGNKPSKKDDIDAKLKAAGLKTMNFTSGGIENKTNEEAKQTIGDVLSSKIDENLNKLRNKSFVVPESIPQIFDRFTSTNSTNLLTENDSIEAKPKKETPTEPVAPKEVQKVIRTKSVWVPCQLLCYKMNIEANVGSKPEKGSSFSLFECIANTDSARRNRLEFTSNRRDDSDYSELKKIEERAKQVKTPPNVPKTVEEVPLNPFASKLPENITKSLEIPESTPITETKAETSSVKRVIKPKTELELKIIDAQNEHPSKKKDIFKAIFSDSESDDSEEDDDVTIVPKSTTINEDLIASLTKPSTSTSSLFTPLPDIAFKPKSAREMNILRNTSPPRGIFSGLTKKSEPPRMEFTEKNCSLDKMPVDDPNSYGPSLPPSAKPNTSYSDKPEASSSRSSNPLSTISLGKSKVIYEEQWIEKTDEKEKKSKKEKKHKKDRDKHKSKKQKKEKHKKKKR